MVKRLGPLVKVDLPYLHIYRAKRRVYAYYRRGGQQIRVPGVPGSPAFLEAYKRVHESFDVEPVSDRIAPGSLADLVTAFKASPEWRSLKPATRASYAHYLDALVAWKGSLAVARMPREFVLKARDRFSVVEKDGEEVASPRRGDYVVAVLRRALAYAVDRPQRFGLRENPAARIKRIAKSQPHQPWPADLLEVALTKWPAPLRRAVRLGLDTGQRVGDCIGMLRSAYQDGQIRVVQQKTGAELWIHATDELATMIAEAPKTAVTILTMENGRPWDRHHLARAIKAEVEKSGFTGYSFHGLRKNAAVRLAEVGCSSHEIAAVTGHATLAMVEGYTRGANQRRLNKAAILRLKKNASETPSG